MKRLLLSAIIALISLTGCPDPTSAESGSPKDISYVVTGSAGEVVDLTIENSSGSTEQYANVTLPWTSNFRVDGGYHFLYCSAQDQGQAGTIKVEIKVGGAVKKTSSASGQYSIATASMSVGHF